jgi:hypothetical protein
MDDSVGAALWGAAGTTQAPSRHKGGGTVSVDRTHLAYPKARTHLPGARHCLVPGCGWPITPFALPHPTAPITVPGKRDRPGAERIRIMVQVYDHGGCTFALRSRRPDHGLPTPDPRPVSSSLPFGDGMYATPVRAPAWQRGRTAI